MKKDTYYFSHDLNARNDEKILELRAQYGAEGYGIFWMIVETMAENENGGIKDSFIGGLSHGYGVAKGWLKQFLSTCVDIGLFFEKDGYYFSNRLLAHKELRNNLSEWGRLGAEKKWAGHRGANGVANGVANWVAVQRKGKERKGKENKIKKGGYFLENQTKVVYDGGEIQDLTAEETELARQGKLLPKDFEKEIA